MFYLLIAFISCIKSYRKAFVRLSIIILFLILSLFLFQKVITLDHHTVIILYHCVIKVVTHINVAKFKQISEIHFNISTIVGIFSCFVISLKVISYKFRICSYFTANHD